MTDRVYDLLTAPQHTAARIRAKRRQRAERLAGLLPGAIRYDLPRVQSSPKDRMSETMSAVDRCDDQIELLREVLRYQRRHIIDTVAQLENEQAGRCLVLHYVNGLKWSDVARAMHKSESTIFRWQREAADQLDEILSIQDVDKNG